MGKYRILDFAGSKGLKQTDSTVPCFTSFSPTTQNCIQIRSVCFLTNFKAVYLYYMHIDDSLCHQGQKKELLQASRGCDSPR